MRHVLFAILIAVCWCGCSKGDEERSDGSSDDSGFAAHPRIMLTEANERMVKGALERNAALVEVHKQLMSQCATYQNQSPVTYTKQGIRLSVASTASTRIMNLAYAYRLSHDVKYAQRAEREMLALCDFQDWNPSHFLDVAEVAMGMGLGYDWLYDVLSDKTRDRVCQAIYTKAILPSRDKSYNNFYNRKNNWNSVCNAGLVIAALAIYESNPDMCRSVIEKCVQTNPGALGSYGPDGGYPEGPSYWEYGTMYQVMMFNAMTDVLGTDYGLSETPGFMESARFVEYMNAPSGQCFNFSDANATAGSSVATWWFAAKTGDRSLLYLENKRLTANPRGYCSPHWLVPFMVFASQVGVGDATAPDSPYWVNGGELPVFVYRGGWESADDTYIGVKGGSATTPHAHMDAGSFVYEYGGVRWAMDLGMQDYYSLESAGVALWDLKQNGQRWDIFRYCNQAHSTLTVNDARHVAAANARITETFTGTDSKGALVDLTSTLGNELKSAVRTVMLGADDALEVVDSIEAQADRSADVMWVMVTPASARVADGGDGIELTKDGRRMLLTVDAGGLTPTMRVWDNVPPHEYDHPNPGTWRVGFTVRLAAGKRVNLRVRLKPLVEQ